MKPKQRLEQKQSARLYLRKKDHREVIMNDIYHNAIWMKKEQDGEEKDELVWVKYPKHALVNAVSNNNYGTLCWMDADRQFQFGQRYLNGNAQAILLDNGVCVYAVTRSSSSRVEILASVDGMIWQNFGEVGLTISFYHFCDNGLVSYSLSGTNCTVNAVFFEVDEENNISIEKRTFKFSTSGHYYFLYMCDTSEGCLFYKTIQTEKDGNYIYQNSVYHLNKNGVFEKRYENLSASYVMLGDGKSAYCRCGSKIVVASCNAQQYNRYTAERIHTFYAYESDDGGTTWSENQFENYRHNADTSPMRIDCCVRDGEFFVFYGSTRSLGAEIKVYASYTGTSWNKIELPSWVDLPICKDGTCVNQNTTLDELRIAIKPNETSDYNIRLWDLINEKTLNRRSGNILFKDGKATEAIEEDIYFCFGSTQGWKAFFDNKYLPSSSRAFAWQTASVSTYGEVPETIQENDYCVRTVTPIESEVEE